MNQEEWEKVKAPGQKVAEQSRNALVVKLRFLDVAINRLPLRQSENSEDEFTLRALGDSIEYNPYWACVAYNTENTLVSRCILHSVLHCVFRHIFVPEGINERLWDIATDIAIENIILELCLPAVRSERDYKQREYINELQRKVPGVLSAEKIYSYLLQNVTDGRELQFLERTFYRDDHSPWHNENNGGQSQGNSDDGGGGQQPQGNGGGGGGQQPQGGGQQPRSDREELRKQWQDISRRVQADLDLFPEKHSLDPGALIQELEELNREKYDYAEFLRKFTRCTEEMAVNQDEFDYVFYTYGLNLYKDMQLPIIEPLEYRETNKIHDFVIAIDTSGSVQGDLVQTFLQKTYNMIKTGNSFGKKFNLHLIQCDAKIQEHAVITNEEEFDRYLASLHLRGFGGTDFRPVFELVNGMVERHEIEDLRGLLYFTDGYGTFPVKAPNYKTAFVFVQEACSAPDVPPWAIKLLLRPEDIEE